MHLWRVPRLVALLLVCLVLAGLPVPAGASPADLPRPAGHAAAPRLPAPARLQAHCGAPAVDLTHFAFLPALNRNSTPAQNPTLTLLGQSRGGMTNGVAAQGNCVAFGAGNSVIVADAADPARTVPVGQSPDLPDLVEDVSWLGSHLYVADYGGDLQILDVSNVWRPVVAGSLDLPNNRAWGIDVAGNTAYLATEGGLYVVDVSDAAKPVQRGRIGAIEDGWAVDVKDSRQPGLRGLGMGRPQDHRY